MNEADADCESETGRPARAWGLSPGNDSSGFRKGPGRREELECPPWLTPSDGTATPALQVDAVFKRAETPLTFPVITVLAVY